MRRFLTFKQTLPRKARTPGTIYESRPVALSYPTSAPSPFFLSRNKRCARELGPMCVEIASPTVCSSLVTQLSVSCVSGEHDRGIVIDLKSSRICHMFGKRPIQDSLLLSPIGKRQVWKGQRRRSRVGAARHALAPVDIVSREQGGIVHHYSVPLIPQTGVLL